MRTPSRGGGVGSAPERRPEALWPLRATGALVRRGEGRRRWRSLDLGTVQVVVEADAPRVRCPEHGVVVAAVPWARHGAGHTYGFDDQVAWLPRCSKSAVRDLMRVAWRTVGAIVSRVGDDARPRSTGSPGCAASGWTRSVTRKVIAT